MIVGMNIETLQIVIIAALSVATILITVIGIQIILLLKEIRVITKRINYLSSGFVKVADTVEKSVKEVSTITEGAKVVAGIVRKLITKNKDSDED